MPKTKLRKAGLIKKGAPHPLYPSHKFVSGHLKKSEADKAEHDLLEKPDVAETSMLHIPKQHLVYARPKRITPKTPKLRR